MRRCICGPRSSARFAWCAHLLNHPARRAVRHGEGTDDLADTRRRQDLQIDLDFIDHALRVSTSDGAQRQFALPGQSVVSFYAAIMASLWETGIHIAIDEMPNRIAGTGPVFGRPRKHASYDPPAVRRFLQILVNGDRVCQAFRPLFGRRARSISSGQLRSRGDTVFGTPRAAPSGGCLTSPTTSPAKPIPTRRAAPVFGPQRRDRLSGVLFYAYPEPAGFRARRCGRMLRFSARLWVIHSALRRSAHRRGAGPGVARFPAKHLQRPRPTPPNGIAMHGSAPGQPAWYGRSNSLAAACGLRACASQGREPRMPAKLTCGTMLSS